MFVGDDPSAAISSQAEGDAQAIAGVETQLVLGRTTQQGPRERDVGSGGDLKVNELERPSRSLKFKEWRPRRPIRIEPANSLLGRRYVEHHDVLGVIRENGVKLAGVYAGRPPRDQCSNLLHVIRHMILPIRSSSCCSPPDDFER
jgi:hypothetical protein